METTISPERVCIKLSRLASAARLRGMPRALLALLAVWLVLSSPPASGAFGAGAGPRSKPDSARQGAPIVLRGRVGLAGPWRRYLWLKLRRVDITTFSVCAIWNRSSPPPPNCHGAPGDRLPQGTVLRLEQRRLRPASRPWTTVGISRDAALSAVLSNTVSGNRLGTVTYRVTLRSPEGRIFRTSNAFNVFWHP
jgi:hypothetical protein